MRSPGDYPTWASGGASRICGFRHLVGEHPASRVCGQRKAKQVALADQLAQLIVNLLINAMDALETVTKRPPTITIATRVEGRHVCSLVENNGHGMAKTVLERACEAFHVTRSAGKGAGLGLSLCCSTMKNQEGRIEIDSTPGAGTRVQAFSPIKKLFKETSWLS